jgi:hypothetical protein
MLKANLSGAEEGLPEKIVSQIEERIWSDLDKRFEASLGEIFERKM